MIAIIMGVSGSGKTTVGRALAERLGWEFIDADTYHPPANIDKMSRGIPLQDEDRKPWLETLAELLRNRHKQHRSAVLACSALKQSYRDILSKSSTQPIWIYLRGSHELFLQRMKLRPNHYMKPEMLDSQFDVLEEPSAAIVVDAALEIPDQVDEICRQLLFD